MHREEPVHEPSDPPLTAVPLDLSDEAAAKLTDFLLQIAHQMENHYAEQLSRYHTIGHRAGATTLKVEQPPRARAGAARSSSPTPGHSTPNASSHAREFSLSPSEREITASLRHERDNVAGGRLAVMVAHTQNPGHSKARPDNAIGIAWRKSW